MFGPQTQRGVARFQRSRHLSPTGVVTRRTWVLLRHPTVRPHAGARFWSGFRIGMRGPVVRQIQHLLGLHPDGFYGASTAAAVARFQHARRLWVSGRVNHRTLVLIRHPGAWRHHGKRHSRMARARRPSGHRTHRFRALGVGAAGRTVRYYQRILGVSADGVFGPVTRAAVVEFQRRHRLPVTGTVTRRTLVWMRHPLARVPGTPVAPAGQRAVAIAKRQIGIRYTWGGASRRTGFDCSGLVYYVYKRLGIRLPRVTYQQWHAGPHIPRDRLRPGDLVFFHRLGHVAIWVGHEWFIQAPHTGAQVQAGVLRGWFRHHYDGAVRVS
jgi:peptidoglycan hydrolase-like protein with peptidoglycan-binding domain